jgi:hypothetical protein
MSAGNEWHNSVGVKNRARTDPGLTFGLVPENRRLSGTSAQVGDGATGHGFDSQRTRRSDSAHFRYRHDRSESEETDEDSEQEEEEVEMAGRGLRGARDRPSR